MCAVVINYCIAFIGRCCEFTRKLKRMLESVVPKAAMAPPAEALLVSPPPTAIVQAATTVVIAEPDRIPVVQTLPIPSQHISTAATAAQDNDLREDGDKLPS